MKMEEFNLSSSHLLTRSHSLAGNVSISWKQIDLCSSHLNHQLQMFDFNCWKYYINKTEEEEECMHSRSRDKNSFCLQKCICLSPRMHFLVKIEYRSVPGFGTILSNLKKILPTWFHNQVSLESNINDLEI